MIQYIGICGSPTAGKSKVQEILERDFEIAPLDDSRPLRDATKILYGLSEEDVNTQAGKKRLVKVGDKEIPVRNLIGELGEHLEKNDPLHVPRMALSNAKAERPDDRVSFGSLRMRQGLLFQEDNSLVIEVVRPGAISTNEFDRYDPDLAHVTVVNDFDPEDPEESFLRLVREVHEKIGPLLSC